MTNRATYAVIRTTNLATALSAFRDRFGADPVAVIVNAGLVEQIEAALGGEQIPVLANGGALLGELWLEQPAVDCETAVEVLRSLAACVSQAQRGRPVSETRQLALELMEVEQ